MEQATHNTAV